MSITYSTLRDDRGMVLAVVLMFLVVLAAMGSAAVMMTRAEIKTGDNYKNSELAFFLAQAGAEHARDPDLVGKSSPFH